MLGGSLHHSCSFQKPVDSFGSCCCNNGTCTNRYSNLVRCQSKKVKGTKYLCFLILINKLVLFSILYQYDNQFYNQGLLFWQFISGYHKSFEHVGELSVPFHASTHIAIERDCLIRVKIVLEKISQVIFFLIFNIKHLVVLCKL